MGIQLDWQIQAEQTQQRDQEDPEMKRRRRRNRFRLLVAAAVVVGLICIGLGVIVWKLQSRQDQVENDLRASVEAEFVAIQLGDQNAFMDIQRSASEVWVESQRKIFQEYQTLKVNGRLSSDFQVVEVDTDGERGRVIIEEKIDGRVFRQAWFYWHYGPIQNDAVGSEDEPSEIGAGWRRVPADIYFWGDEAQIENDRSTVVYHELDRFIAEPLAEQVESWWASACTWLQCTEETGHLELIIDPQAGIPMAWEPEDGWRLRMLSPLVNGRVATDGGSSFQGDVARALAERLIVYASAQRLNFFDKDGSTLPPYDTTWVKYQLRDWLAARFLNAPSPFFDSLITAFGDAAPANIARGLIDGAQINSLGALLNPSAGGLLSLDPAVLGQIDWAPYFEWRLALEHQRLSSDDFNGFYALYESGNLNQAAAIRANDVSYRTVPAPDVTQATFTARADATPVVVLDVVDSAGAASQISFVWTGDTFLRVD
jgi:hypothetical protein